MNLPMDWKSKCLCGLFVVLLWAMVVIPATRAEPAAAPPPAEVTSNTLALDYVPPDSMFVLAVRPAELLGAAQHKVVQALVEILGVEYEQLTFAQRKATPQGSSYLAFDAEIVRTTEAVTWRDILREKNKLQFVEHDFEGHSYDVNSQLRNVAGYQADDRTLLIAPPWNLKPMMTRGKGERSDFPWADAWRQAAHSPLVIFMDASYGREQLKSLVTTGLGVDFADAFSPLWEDLRWVIVSVGADTPMEIEIAATYGGAETGRRAFTIATGLLNLEQDEIEQNPQASRRFGQWRCSGPPEDGRPGRGIRRKRARFPERRRNSTSHDVGFRDGILHRGDASFRDPKQAKCRFGSIRPRRR